MPQTCGNIILHLIFSTKKRLPLIKPEICADLFAYLGGIIHEMRGTAVISTAPPLTFMYSHGFGPHIQPRESRE
jgi:hypothetical protein